MKIYLIKKLWTDSLENDISDAIGYEAIGFVKTQSEADKMIRKAGYQKGTGYPIGKGEAVPILIVETVTEI